MPEAASAYNPANDGSSWRKSCNPTVRPRRAAAATAICALVAAVAAGGDTPVMALFRQWAAALDLAVAETVTDAETDRRTDVLGTIEARLRLTEPRDPRDFAAKTYVAMYAIDGFTCRDNRALLNATLSDEWAFAVCNDVLRGFPELAAMLHAGARA